MIQTDIRPLRARLTVAQTEAVAVPPPVRPGQTHPPHQADQR